MSIGMALIQKFARDSLLEEAGFELSVPPERKAALDRVRRPSVTRRQAYPHRATRGGSVVKRTAETAANSDPFARRSAVKKRFFEPPRVPRRPS
jgi:hypothetical protein